MMKSSSPFKFLDSYSKEDHDIFFGRDREIETLYQKVFESKILLLYGVSGTGKTSLINCGLANKFEDSDWLTVNIRRGGDISSSLRDSIAEMALSEVSKGKSVTDLLKSVYLDHFKPIYLIFDQFEELFIFGNRHERDSFIHSIKELVDSDVQCRIIFSIREEYLAGMTEFEPVIPDILSNRMRIEKMTPKNAIQVIEGPCGVHGIKVEDGFPEALLQRLDPDSSEIELTYLQVFLDKIYKLMEGKELKFNLDLLDMVGDVSDLLGSFLEDQIHALKDPDTGLTALKAFVSVKGTKRQITFEEIIEFSESIGKPIAEAVLTNLIQHFINLRVLRDKDDNGRYELRHDSLAAKIFEKITLVEKELLEVRQFIENSFENYTKTGKLLTEEDIDYIKVYEDRLFLRKELDDYVKKSRSFSQKKMKSLYQITSISVVGLILTILLISNYNKRKRGERDINNTSVESLIQKEMVPKLAFETALTAYQQDTSNTLAIKALFESFYTLLDRYPTRDSLNLIQDPIKQMFNFRPVPTGIVKADFTEDGSKIFGLLGDNTFRMWNISGEVLLTISPDFQVLTVKVSQDNKFIGMLGSDSLVYIYDNQGNITRKLETGYDLMHPEDVFQFGYEGSMIYLINPGYGIDMVDLSNDNITRIKVKDNVPVYDLAVHKNGKWLVTGDRDGNTLLYRQEEAGSWMEFRKFKSHRGRTWSVGFNTSHNYILTASDDSTYRIWDFNGREAYGPHSRGYKFRNREAYCNARFEGNDQVIILTAYYKSREGIPTFIQTDFSKQSVLVNSLLNQYLRDSRLELDDLAWSTPDSLLSTLQDFSLSPDGRFYSFVLKGDSVTRLVAHDDLPVFSFPATHSTFDKSGNYLLCIKNNQLNLFPVSETEIIRLVLEEEIFGELDYNLEKWFPVW